MLRYAARSTAPPEVAWALLARPSAWADWAPHLSGAWGLGRPEVQVGARGAARVLGVLPVPARITAKDEGRSWTWRVGVIDMDHVVEPAADGRGCTIAVILRAPSALERVLKVTYGPVVAVLVRHLARVAERAPVNVNRSARARRRPTGTRTPRR